MLKHEAEKKIAEILGEYEASSGMYVEGVKLVLHENTKIDSERREYRTQVEIDDRAGSNVWIK